MYKIGETLSIGEGAPGLIVTGYERDQNGNIIGYEVTLANCSFGAEKPVAKTWIEQ